MPDVIYRGPGRRFVIDDNVLERDGVPVSLTLEQINRLEDTQGRFDVIADAQEQADQDEE